jgi:heme exporter protein D
MIDLGKYAADVVLAYGISLGLIVGLIAFSMYRAKRMKADLSAAEARIEARQNNDT